MYNILIINIRLVYITEIRITKEKKVVFDEKMSNIPNRSS